MRSLDTVINVNCLGASGCASPRISYRKLLTGLRLGLLVILRAYTYLQETSNFDSYRSNFAPAAIRLHDFVKNGSS
jgi:hypothetical protein